MFQFHDKIKAAAAAAMHNVSLAYRVQTNMTSEVKLTYIGVHVRRGDMLHERELIDEGFIAAPLLYLQMAMQYYRARHKNTLFLVCSDDIKWCRKNLVADDVKFMAGTSPSTDLAILAGCDSVIMTVGTFGWWGAYLSGGHAIYYPHQARNGSNLARRTRIADFALPHWTAIHV